MWKNKENKCGIWESKKVMHASVAYIYARRWINLAILRIMIMNFFGFSNAAFMFFTCLHLLDFTFSHLLYFTFSHLLDFTFSHLLDFTFSHLLDNSIIGFYILHISIGFWTFVFFIFPFWVSFSVYIFAFGEYNSKQVNISGIQHFLAQC